MGYGYGVCLVYDDDELLSIHIPHFVVSRFMSKDDAFSLHKKLSKKTGPLAQVQLNGKSQYFYSSYKEYDNNKLCAWGYEGRCDKWRLYGSFCEKYKCEFIPEPTTCLGFSIYPKVLKPHNINNKTIQCKLYAMDLRSDFPEDWKVIKEGISSFL